MILDFGCGTAKMAEAIGVDIAALPGVDIVHDLLDFPYPFESATADEIYLNHVIEHFTLGDYQRILGEVFRILRPDGIAHVRVPHVFSVAAWADPTHKSSFTFISAEFFTRNSAKAYYQETASIWELASIQSRVTWFNWKRYRLRQFDSWLSSQLSRLLDWLLTLKNAPGMADWMVKAAPMFFVEVRWDLRKPSDGECIS